MGIYEIDADVRSVASAYIDNEEGLDPEDYVGRMMRESKALALDMAKYIKECEHDIAGMKEAEQSIASRRKALEKKVGRLKGYVLTLVEGKVSDSFVSISTRKSDRVVLSDNFEVDDYMVEKLTRSPDKAKIKEDLKCGVVIDGASLEQCLNLVIK